MKIFGTISNSNNQDPVKGANIRFSIEGTEITSVISNEHGEYEYIAEEDHIGQTLDFAIQKDGFESKNISYEIDEDEIKADILLNDAGISDDEVTVTVKTEELLPQLSINLDPLSFDFGSMNEGETDSSTFSVVNIGGGILKWNIIDDQPWITVTPTSGTESGSVTVSVDTIMIDPGDYTGEIIIESNGGTEKGMISLYVTAPSPDKNEALEFSLKIVETYFTGDADQFSSYLADTIYTLEGGGPISKEELIDEIYGQQFPFGYDYSEYTMGDYFDNYNPYILDYGQYSEEYPSILELSIDGWSPDEDDFLFVGWDGGASISRRDRDGISGVTPSNTLMATSCQNCLKR